MAPSIFPIENLERGLYPSPPLLQQFLDFDAASAHRNEDQPIQACSRLASKESDGVRPSTEIRTIQRDDDLDRIAAMVTPEENHIQRLGILAIEIDSKIAQVLPPPRKHGGVLVAAMAADGPNRNGGLLPGDVIYAFNGKSISGLPALRSELESLKTGDAVVLYVQRQRNLMYLAFELESVAN